MVCLLKGVGIVGESRYGFYNILLRTSLFPVNSGVCIVAPLPLDRHTRITAAKNSSLLPWLGPQTHTRLYKNPSSFMYYNFLLHGSSYQ